ncbi:solute carrier family 25 (mitochondrial folate transporter), member 32 [Geosmithia morbida]|uniref:Solute carrier family 25 (Mitochondrial folate transporter), member 32 n=1 Tax=Geosmithia morbida TaxID=1094350 RepID=A0A9P5D3H4_9HYPO|nr:solute carrier family 25 (mitochondrial folate transporter), member 32 [Geosmithia morbida]KAF4120514.1 solute carrier family 25 (mitochondrial folate transporter), member 32 [Geosmithia morbida]
MPSTGDAGLSPAVVESIAGLSAGTVSTLVVHPLDIVKTRMQISRSTPTADLPRTMTIIRSMTSAGRPVAALYRGLTPNLVGNATGWASFFFFKARAERALSAWRGRGPRAADGRDPPPPPTSAWEFLAAPALAGVATTALTNPIWVIKTRMLSSDRGAAGAYPSMMAGVRSILRGEGLRGFYRGLGVSLFGVSHGAVQFAVYEPLKRMYLASASSVPSPSSSSHGNGNGNGDGNIDGAGGERGRGRVGEERGGPMPVQVTMLISGGAKLVAGAVTYPYQVLRSRLQNLGAEERFGRGIAGVVRTTWRDEGVRGFYRGVVPGVVRVMPATWVTFLVYENVRFHLPRWV